jgi:hypothetical protein
MEKDYIVKLLWRDGITLNLCGKCIIVKASNEDHAAAKALHKHTIFNSTATTVCTVEEMFQLIKAYACV